ncbi:MAG: hypothetical protein Fur0016_03080 [Anaerolineales bacterium]
MTTNSTLPPGFTLRAATWNDLEPVADLIRAVCEADGDPDDAVPASEIKSEWEANFDLETDVWVVTDPAGKVVGYEEFFARPGHASLQGDGYVHPEFEGLGIGTALLRWGEARVRMALDQFPANLWAAPHFSSLPVPRAHDLAESLGWQKIRPQKAEIKKVTGALHLPETADLQYDVCEKAIEQLT